MPLCLAELQGSGTNLQAAARPVCAAHKALQCKPASSLLKLSTAVKVRWMGEAVPGRVVNSRRQRPSSRGESVGAATPPSASSTATAASNAACREAGEGRENGESVDGSSTESQAAAMAARAGQRPPTLLPPGPARQAPAAPVSCRPCRAPARPLSRPSQSAAHAPPAAVGSTCGCNGAPRVANRHASRAVPAARALYCQLQQHIGAPCG